jgi:hypothetical protein
MFRPVHFGSIIDQAELPFMKPGSNNLTTCTATPALRQTDKYKNTGTPSCTMHR